MSFTSEVLADSPLVYWLLNEASGTTAVDGSGNARDGVYNLTPSVGGGAELVNGAGRSARMTNDSISIVDAAWMDVPSWSLEIWFASTDLLQGRGLACRDNASGARHWDLHLNELTTGKVSVTGWITNTRTDIETISTGYNNGAPHHVVATYDAATLRLYVDNVQQGPGVAITGLNSNVTSPISVGAHAGGAGITGDLQAFAYYSTALSPARISAHFAAGTPLTGAASDPVGLTDSITTQVVKTAAASDLLGLRDSITLEKGRFFSEPVGLRDAITMDVQQSPSDSAGLSDQVSTELFPAGSIFFNPFPLTGSGTQPFTTIGSVREAGEPPSAAGPDTTGTIWFRYVSTAPGTLTLSADPAWDDVIEVFDTTSDVDTMADLELLTFGSGLGATAELLVAQDTVYWLRVHATNPGADQAATLTYDFAARVQLYAVDVLADLFAAPGVVQVNVTNGVAGETVTFKLGTVTLIAGTLDDSGQLLGATVPIPAGTTAGTKTLTAATPSFTATDTFEVLTTPVIPTGLVPPVGPITTPTVRWRLQDAAAGGATFTFPNNPTTMSSPLPERSITAEATVSAVGQALIWEGAARPYSWEFAGYCGTQAFHEQLRAFTNLKRRFYLTDHRNRTWIVSFDAFEAIPRRDLGNDWAHNYTMRATIYGGPL